MSAGHILTLNAGSSSLKFGLFSADGETCLAHGLADRIGRGGTLGLHLPGKSGPDLPALPGAAALTDHHATVEAILTTLAQVFPGLAVRAVGHRVVHGGPDFTAPVVLDAGLVARLEAFSPFAPLHQPHNLDAVRAAFTHFPAALQVAAFDTAFHRSQPFVNDTYALPPEWYARGLRRYGFHGLSYQFIAGELARTAPDLHAGRVVVAHLGSGASICAMHNGQSIACTMGFSTLSGLPMGTRAGELDAGVVLYLMDQEKMNAEDITELLFKRSGLIGMSGVSNDMRTLEASKNPHAKEAIDYFCHLAVAPEFLPRIEKGDKAFAASEFLPKMRWLKDV
ncbi:hypothetical protein EOM89_11540, partial [Candidatus Falkowbacteria bacterium]|nr:hypothetical protein [Candidatus Falkowbacteria bacterium]